MSGTEMPIGPTASQLRAKRILIGFGATTLIGLALAGWYVGGRILAIEKVHAAAASKPIIAVPVSASSSVDPKPVEAPPASDAVNPQPGEIYLQLAAMGPRTAKDYLKTLGSQGIHPRIAPSPATNVYRILIGPYPDKAALEKERHLLQSSGIEAIVQIY